MAVVVVVAAAASLAPDGSLPRVAAGSHRRDRAGRKSHSMAITMNLGQLLSGLYLKGKEVKNIFKDVWF